MLGINEFIYILKLKNYEFELSNHIPVFTVEESRKARKINKGSHSKNLFLKNKKNNFFLVSCEEREKISLKEMSKSLNLGNVSFANEEYLLKCLGIKPGSVSPFALLNDENNIVSFFLEKKLYDSEFVNFHPLLNNATITMKTNDFINFMIENKKKIHIFSYTEGLIIKTYE